jgi:hypothetical protein
MSDKSDRKLHVNSLMNFGDPWDSIIPNNDSTNLFIAGLGIIFNHYVAIPNPIYESNLGDLRRIFPEDDTTFNLDKRFDFIENGFLYKYTGQVWGIFQGNNKQFREIASGLYSSSGALITFNRYYRGSDKYASFAEYDKLIPCISGKDFFSVNWEKTQVSQTGINRLQFPACEIEYVIDSTGKFYYEGQDFKLENGHIKWISIKGADRPGIDPLSGKSRIISVRYKYKPTFYVKSLAHDIRMHASFDSQGEPQYPLSTTPEGDIVYKPGPSSVNIVADYIFLDRRTANEDRVDAQIEDDNSDNGNIGPR